MALSGYSQDRDPEERIGYHRGDPLAEGRKALGDPRLVPEDRLPGQDPSADSGNGHGKEKRSAALREIRVNDILFREEVQLDMDSIGVYLNGKDVLVTGGGGSIGSEICRQAARFNIKSLTIFDIYENTAYELHCELKRQYGDALDVKIRIGSVREIERLEAGFCEVHPQIVFHAAAHKHVAVDGGLPAGGHQKQCTGHAEHPAGGK